MMNDLRIGRRLYLAVLVLTVSLFLLLDNRPASAQTTDPNPNPETPLLYLPLVTNAGEAEPAVEAARRPPPAASIKLLVDTDPGVDDAVALAWLVSQRQQPVQLLGVVTVAGNASLYNTTNNALLILNKLGRQDVPVVMGAAAPLAQPLSKTGYFVHGPDGLWFLGFQNPQDLSHVPANAPAFYCAQVAANPGATLLALGPLTNIAQAVQQCPATMKLVGSLVILGGAKHGGNKTPVAEFNFWQDPEAAEIVLAAGLPTTVVPLDAFTIPAITQKDLDKLLAKAVPAVAFLAPAIQQYAGVQITNTGSASIPDAVAAVLALNSSEGKHQPALIKLILAQSLARGQSIVGLTTSERVAMIADDAEVSALAERAFAYPPDPNFDLQRELGAILMRAAYNAHMVTAAPATLLTKIVFPDLTAR
jgi:inosine-uridine nucleoside N-ribohydrolase